MSFVVFMQFFSFCDNITYMSDTTTDKPEDSKFRLFLGPVMIGLGFVFYLISSTNSSLENAQSSGAALSCATYGGNCDDPSSASTFGLWIAALGFWILMGHLTGKAASAKGRTYSSFFWLGFFLPVIGLIIASTLSPPAPKTVVLAESTAAPNQVSNDSTKKCPLCAELIQIEAVFCKHCRNNLEK
jgi:hypothetical protein